LEILAMNDFFTRLLHFQPALLDSFARDAVHLAVAAFIMVAGWWVSNRVGNFLAKSFAKTHIDPTLIPMLSSIGAWAIRALAAIAALSEVGIATASVLAVLGAAGLAIGLALQGTLQNIAAGIMLLVLRPFRAGDVIEGSGAAAGVVREVGLFTTRLERADGNAVFVPNSQIWSNPVVNYSYGGARRVETKIDVSERDRVDASITQIKKLLADHPRVLGGATLAPTVYIEAYSDNGGAVLRVTAWMKDPDPSRAAEDLRRETHEAIKVAAESPWSPS